MIANHPNLQKGQLTYYEFCSHYHRYAGECEIGAMTESAKSFGLHTVPAHEMTGHTGEHSTQLLGRAILNGIDNLLNQNPMSSFGDRLSEQDVDHLIAYMSLWWTDGERGKHRSQSVVLSTVSNPNEYMAEARS